MSTRKPDTMLSRLDHLLPNSRLHQSLLGAVGHKKDTHRRHGHRHDKPSGHTHHGHRHDKPLALSASSAAAAAKLIFIAGAAHSGTSIVQKILASAPGVAAYGAPHGRAAASKKRLPEQLPTRERLAYAVQGGERVADAVGVAMP